MTSARLLAVAIFLCSLAAFAQEPQSSTSSSPSASGQTSSQPQHADAAQPPQDGMNLRQAEALARLARANLDKGISLSQDGQLVDGQVPADTFCYTMRTYVVARDNKNSDAVHPVSYSTCQMSSRYRLKTTQARHDVVGPSVFQPGVVKPTEP
jgi:hypothetical protein